MYRLPAVLLVFCIMGKYLLQQIKIFLSGYNFREFWHVQYIGMFPRMSTVKFVCQQVQSLLSSQQDTKCVTQLTRTACKNVVFYNDSPKVSCSPGSDEQWITRFF